MQHAVKLSRAETIAFLARVAGEDLAGGHRFHTPALNEVVDRWRRWCARELLKAAEVIIFEPKLSRLPPPAPERRPLMAIVRGLLRGSL